MVMSAQPTWIDAYGQRHPRAEVSARIVSLVPSITELLFALDLGAQVVGRTGFCIHPRGRLRDVPKLGGTKDVDFETLAGLAPSHVIVNIDENTRETYARLRELVPQVIVTHPNTPADNLELFALLGGIFDREQEAAALSAAFRAALDGLRGSASGLPAQRVLYLIWREPWMTVAPVTYIANMLKLVNWHTVPATPRVRYPSLSADELCALAPDLCLLSSEPYPFRDKHIAELQTLLPPATPVRLIDGEMVSWYGSRAILGLTYLASYATQLRAV